MSINQSPQLILDLPENPPSLDDERPTVDTTRPFRSVKEAVAIFGERLQPVPKQETPIWKHAPNSNQTLWKSSESDQEPSPLVMTTLKKLEFELKETKRELKLLKERESETEVALASLNAELHKNMSKIAKVEAVAAGQAVVVRRRRTPSITMREVLSGFGGEREMGRESMYLNEKKVLKKKPVIPLVTDLFAWKIND
ncbi:uncharacterized protein LOC143579182 [Bidens hawaiensis]|uniref:uncharacterized protein LOC143579182 n=1 Tax=Bidens hawaiensis TaxID=980011 RepID=UPI00404ADBFF